MTVQSLALQDPCWNAEHPITREVWKTWHFPNYYSLFARKWSPA